MTVPPEALRPSGLYKPEQIITQLEGGLNRTTVVMSGSLGDLAMKLAIRRPKTPEERSATEAGIRAEYRNIGALARGVDFRLRTPAEQRDFMSESTSLGLQTLPCQMLLGREIVTEFIEGTPLDKYVQQNPDPSVLRNVLTHLTQAHSLGVVFGDRWATNTMIKPEGDHVELDFDILLQGDPKVVRTFELSQALYHMVHFAGANRADVTNVLADTYNQQPHLLAIYDQTEMNHLLSGHNYFYDQYRRDGTMYENMVPPGEEIDQLTSSLNSAWTKVPEGPVTNSLPRITAELTE